MKNQRWTLFCNQKANLFLWSSKCIQYSFPCWSTSHSTESFAPCSISLLCGPGGRKGPQARLLGRGGPGGQLDSGWGLHEQVTAGCPLKLPRCFWCCPPCVLSSRRGSPPWQHAGITRGVRRATDARAAPLGQRSQHLWEVGPRHL